MAAASQQDLLSHQRRLAGAAAEADQELKLALYLSACDEAQQTHEHAGHLRAAGRDFEAARGAFARAR